MSDFTLTNDSLKKIIRDKTFDGSNTTKDDVFQALRSNEEHGLSSAQALTNKAHFGENRLPDKPLKPYYEHLLEALSDPILIALIICSIITIIFGAVITKDPGDWAEGIGIIVAVIIVSGVGSVNNWLQEAQFASLTKVKSDRTVLVIRNNEEVPISIYDVAVGDIFVIKTGEILPVDGILLKGSSGIKCDESAMTGESLEISKAPGAFMFSGGQVTSGAGRMLVLTTGVNTSYGQIVIALQDAEPPPTPLQEKLEEMATFIGYLALAGGVLIFLVLLIAYLVKGNGNYPNPGSYIMSFFIIGIVIIVVAVPEGLPLAVMLALAYTMKQMIKDMVLVRDLKACETMGSATTICSDKTGTLTENRMTVIKGFFMGQTFNESLPVTDADVGGSDRTSELAKCICLNSDAGIEGREGDGKKIIVHGNKTEGALLLLLRKSFSIEYDTVRRANGKYLFRENFSSARKRMTTMHAPASGSSDYSVYCKGASEAVLALCTKYVLTSGEVVPLDDAKKVELEKLITTYAERGLRTLTLASKKIPSADLPSSIQSSLSLKSNGTPESEEEVNKQRSDAWDESIHNGSIEKDMVLLSIVGIADPVRAAVPDAVARCKSAGIKVRMVTGDNLITAKFIAEECGIIESASNNTSCIEGSTWREMTDEQRKEFAPKLDVMARAIPTDKLLLVETLKSLGETVAVTGDGTNDAPALRAAHVGCAMGIAGTEVAKEAGKMIILDDNFASIVTAVIWGRSVLENIRKFLVFQLTINLVAGGVTFVMACVNAAKPVSSEHPDFPLTAIQLLWINLLMDSLAALMLATEPPDPELMKMPPQDKSRPLLSKTMNKYVIVHGIYQIILLLCLSTQPSALTLFQVNPVSKKGHDTALGEREHYTNIFNVFVLLQVFNLFNARRIHDQWDIFHGIEKSTTAMTILVLIVVGQILIIQVGGDVFKTAPLTGQQWGVDIALGATSIPIGWICRLIPYQSEDDVIGYAPKNIVATHNKLMLRNAPPA
jgi:P-type Ca2+ transporter type 2C